MGKRFTDYCASNITPQMTLLEKLNKIIEYLKTYPSEVTVLFLHKYTYESGAEISFISNTNEELDDYKIKLGFLFLNPSQRIVMNLSYKQQKVVDMDEQISGMKYYYCYGSEIRSEIADNFILKEITQL